MEQIFAKSTCKWCNGKGYMVFAPSAIHQQRTASPCRCLIKNATAALKEDHDGFSKSSDSASVKSMDVDNLNSYDTVLEKIDGVETMFLRKKTKPSASAPAEVADDKKS